MSRGSRPREEGQIMIIFATAFFFVLVGSAALTIDLGNSMLQQRRLQNATDAAAVAAAAELSRGATPAAAAAVAQNVVTSNYSTVSLTYNPSGTQGVNLTNGIEINGDEVRVAAQTPVKTFLAGVIGVKTVTVGARSRAAMKYQGLMPVAVKRFSAGDSSQPISVINPRKGDAYDILTVANSNPLAEWPGGNPPLSASANLDVLKPGTGTAASDPGPGQANVCGTGAGSVFPFTGREALANIANGNDFHFWIAPDIRNITSASPDYYNNVQSLTSAQQVKNQESQYFVKGYPSSPPAVGEQVAAFSGVNDSSTVQLIQQTYPRGTYVVAMVYDGTVYRRTDFQMNMVPAWLGNSFPGGESYKAQFPIQLSPVNGFNEPINLSVVGPNGWHWEFDKSNPLDGSVAHSVSLRIWPDSAFSGAATFEVTASSPNVFKSQEATVVAGNSQLYSISSEEAYKTAAQGSSTQFNLALISQNNFTSPPDVSIPGAPSGGWSWVGSAPSGVTVTTDTSVATVKKNKPGALTVTIDASSTATPGQYTLKVTTKGGSNTQDIYLTLEIIPPDTDTNITNTTGYVKILGYANFQLTYYNNSLTPGQKDNNTIYACAVSDIKSNPDDLLKGMTPRLIPWR